MLQYDEEKVSLPGVDAVPDEASSYIGSVVGSVDDAASASTDPGNNRSNVVAATGLPFGAPASSASGAGADADAGVPRAGKPVQTRRRGLLALVGAVVLLAVILGVVLGASGGSAAEAPSNNIVGIQEQPIVSDAGGNVPNLPEESTEISSEDDPSEEPSEEMVAFELPEEFLSSAAPLQSSSAPTGSPTAAPTSPPTASLEIDATGLEDDAPSATNLTEGGQVLVVVVGGDPNGDSTVSTSDDSADSDDFGGSLFDAFVEGFVEPIVDAVDDFFDWVYGA